MSDAFLSAILCECARFDYFRRTFDVIVNDTFHLYRCDTSLHAPQNLGRFSVWHSITTNAVFSHIYRVILNDLKFALEYLSIFVN
jgi:hypothetical protein